MKDKIYKIRCVVMKHVRSRIEDVYRNDEKIVIGNLSRAKEIFANEKDKAETYFQCSNYFGCIELFEPHLHENGELAYWPDNDKYIEQFKRET